MVGRRDGGTEERKNKIETAQTDRFWASMATGIESRNILLLSSSSKTPYPAGSGRSYFLVPFIHSMSFKVSMQFLDPTGLSNPNAGIRRLGSISCN